MLAPSLGIEPDPCIVFTTDVPGLVAAEEILDRSDRIACLSGTAFDLWLSQEPDENFRWHVCVWSRFCDPIDADVLEAAREAFPLPEERTYWLHSEGTLWAPLAGRGVDHLWAWDGQEPELLEEAFQSRVF